MVLNNEDKQQSDVIEKKKSELLNLLRLAQNNINLLNEGQFPGSHGRAIIEVLAWMEAINKDIRTQLETINSLVTKPAEAQVIDPEVVS